MSFFNEELELCKKIFDSHNKKKGDSWKTCGIAYLESKLIEEYEKWQNSPSASNEIIELADIINVALMFMSRLRGA